MRALVLAILMLPSAYAGAQAAPDIWKDVNAEMDLPRLQSATPSDAQLKSIAALLRRVDKEDIWE